MGILMRVLLCRAEAGEEERQGKADKLVELLRRAKEGEGEVKA